MLRDGKSIICDVPSPVVDPQSILVQVEYSCISAGTEMMGLKATGLSIVERALKKPQHLKKGLDMITQQGLAYTKNFINTKLSVDAPVGYSTAGRVLEVGQAVQGFSVGDKVACAGAQCAFHSEIISVPANLCVSIPQNLGAKEASTVALGAIALQGVRRLQPTLGEVFVVIGLGILGQLTSQILQANGCVVIGSDLKNDRLDLAASLGMEHSVPVDENNQIDYIHRVTDGNGVDGVVITAAAQSSEIISAAFQMCRKKGRVVLVGDVGLDLKRDDIYEKELDFLISTSYGPGRYDYNYEEKGKEYPLAYVRWSENRNMKEYLRLLATKKVDIDPLIFRVFDFTKIDEAYSLIEENNLKSPLMVLDFGTEKAKLIQEISNPHVMNGVKNSDKLNIAVIGMGEFARATHLPNLKSLSEHYNVHTIFSRKGHNAVNMAKKFGAQKTTSDYQTVLTDDDLNCVLIATKHHQHAEMALAALAAGKHVLVEKPMVLTSEELNKISNFFADQTKADSSPILMTGYNRRFSPYMKIVKKQVLQRKNPMIINYRMNAGYIPKEHWVQTEEGGGRNIGEACHIYDLFTFLTGSQVVSIDVTPIKPQLDYYLTNDNFVVQMAFADGSVASLTYTAMGDSTYPKEHMEIYCDGKVVTMTDYKQLMIHGVRFNKMRSKIADKGHKEELRLFAEAIKNQLDWPIPLWEQIQTAEIALTIEKLLLTDSPRA